MIPSISVCCGQCCSSWQHLRSCIFCSGVLEGSPSLDITSYSLLNARLVPAILSESPNSYFAIIPIIPSQVSTNSGHFVTGNFVLRSPKACPPCAYKWISTGTPAFFSAM